MHATEIIEISDDETDCDDSDVEFLYDTGNFKFALKF